MISFIDLEKEHRRKQELVTRALRQGPYRNITLENLKQVL